MQYYQKQADEAGICAEKIGAVQAIVMAVSAGRVQAQLQAAVGQGSTQQGNEGAAAQQAKTVPAPEC